MKEVNKKRLNSIDFLKVIAIILVVVFHFWYQASGTNSLRVIGAIGVSIFFIVSGFSLANKHHNLTKPSLKWFFQKYIKIASLYYIAILAVILLFATQSYDGNLLQNIISHLFFLNPYSQTPYSFISPAWFLTPLIAFYLFFPLLNFLIKKYRFTLPLFILITTLFRDTPQTFTSPNPLFYLAEFCFGIALFYNKKDILLLSPLILLTTTISNWMILPFAIVYIFYVAETKLPSLRIIKFIGTYTLAIFLFHESFMNLIYNKWHIYNLSKPIALIVLTISTLFAVMISKRIQKLLLKL